MTAVLGPEVINVTGAALNITPRPHRRRALNQDEREFARLLLEFLWEFESVGVRTVVPATAGQWSGAHATATDARPRARKGNHDGTAEEDEEGTPQGLVRRPLRVPPFVAALSEL